MKLTKEAKRLKKQIEAGGFRFMDLRTLECPDGAQHSTINLADGSETNPAMTFALKLAMAEFEAETWEP